MSVLITPGAFTRASSFERLAARLGGQVVELPIRSRRLPQLDLGGLRSSDAAVDAAITASIAGDPDEGRPLVLIGHSMGGLITLRAGMRHRVDALVLLMPAPPGGLLRDVARLVLTHPVAAATLATLCLTTLPARSWPVTPPRGLFTPGVTTEELTSSRAHRADESLRTLLQLLVGSRAPVSVADVPTLVVGGAADGLIPAATVRRLAEQLGADYLELDVAHNFSEEAAGTVVEDEVERWLTSRTSLRPRRHGLRSGPRRGSSTRPA